MKYFSALLFLFICSCAGPKVIKAGPEPSVYGVLLDFRIQSYLHRCDYPEILYIERVKKNKYVGEAFCKYWRR